MLDALRDLVAFLRFKKCEKKNHEGVLVLVKLQRGTYTKTDQILPTDEGFSIDPLKPFNHKP